MAYDELSEHLNALQRDDCYRVAVVMKETPYERTEKVFFVGSNGAEQGPYVRKRFSAGEGLGAAYERIRDAQRAGRRFSYLPRIIDCYAIGDQRVVVMEHVEGETLQDVVYRCDPSAALAADLFPRVCDAVAELHGAFDPPLIHRDIKPSNIMVSRGSLTIIDFGIARTYRDDAEYDTLHFGTKAYAPPEQFGFGQTDARSDVYALGMLLYFCLTERTPDVKARTRGFAAPGVPESLRSIIVRAVELDPADRFQSVDELRCAFARAVEALRRLPETGLAPDQIAASDRMPAMSVCETRQESADRVFPGKVLSRIPLWLGIVWDCFLLALFALLAAASISQMIDPPAGSSMAGYSALKRIVSNGSVLFLVVLPTLYLVSDRRPLKRFVPFLRKLSVPKDVALCLMCYGLVLLVALFSGFMA